MIEATPDHVEQALAGAERAAPEWDAAGAETRAGCLERTADLMEQNRAELMALCVREAGKTIGDAVAEIREAVDFCRYYAARARAEFARPRTMPGPTGERNEVALHGRGVFVCISPWNFPLAIFTGQVSAALAAGHAVIAKPAEQTPLIAAAASRLAEPARARAGCHRPKLAKLRSSSKLVLLKVATRPTKKRPTEMLSPSRNCATNG